MAVRTIEEEASRQVSELWWLWVLQAIVSIVFGLVAMFWPDLTLVTLDYLVAPFIIVIGLIEIVRSLMTAPHRDTWWMSLIIGFLTLGVGIYLARHPGVTFTAFILILGITFIVWGVLEIGRSFLDRVFTHHRALGFIAGLAAIIAGIIVLLQPVRSGVAFVWVLGLYALIEGVFALDMAIEHHRDYQKVKNTLRAAG